MTDAPDDPEIHVTMYVLDDPSVTGRHGDKPVFHWERLLAADSPLITQPVELANYIRDDEGQAFRDHISENRLLSSEDWHAYWAVGMFMEYRRAVSRDDWREGKKILDHVADEIGTGRINNVRRFGHLLHGIAAGGLGTQGYAEVNDFVHYLLPDEEADAIMDKIELRLPPRGLRAKLVRWLVRKGEDMKAAAAGLPEPTIMPTMAKEFGPKEDRAPKG